MAKISFFLVHGWVMWAAWSLVSVLQVATSRYMKHYWTVNMWMHRIGAIFILTATLFYGIYAYLRLGKVFDDVHGPLGLLTTSLVSIIFISGLLARLSLQHSPYTLVKKAHIWFGYLMVILGQVTVCYGITSYYYNRQSQTVLPYFVILTFCVIVAVLERNHRLFLNAKAINLATDQVLTVSQVKSILRLPQLTVIIDDRVVDLTSYQWEHPGGRQILLRMKGRDVTQYFHSHSNYARLIVNQLTIGKLVTADLPQVERQVLQKTWVNNRTMQIKFDGAKQTHQIGQKYQVESEGITREYSCCYDFIGADDSSVIITVKNYNQGLSQLLCRNGSGVFKTKGPMGLGLEVTNGVYVAFAAGTGVLPFMDIVQLILNKKNEFQFELHVSFQSQEDSIGLQELMLARQCDNFKLHLRFSNSDKWDTNYMRKHLSQRVDQIWVCGPESMSEELMTSIGQVGLSSKLQIL